jgi:PLP dependent protein
MSGIKARIDEILSSIPPHVSLVAAAKTRSPGEVREALQCGVHVVGHNYVQEADAMIRELGRDAATWTMIGHLQRNKVRSAVQLFDSIQTVDSLRLAQAIDRACRNVGRVMPVLIEVNAAQEPQKAGVAPAEVLDLIREIAKLPAVRVDGLMTMGPQVEDAEALRPAFRTVKALFDRIQSDQIPGTTMRVLSMGMSDSYCVAIEEGSTMIRLGTSLFGPRV